MGAVWWRRGCRYVHLCDVLINTSALLHNKYAWLTLVVPASHCAPALVQCSADCPSGQKPPICFQAATLTFRCGFLMKAFRCDLAHSANDWQSSHLFFNLWLSTDNNSKEAHSYSQDLILIPCIFKAEQKELLKTWRNLRRLQKAYGEVAVPLSVSD